MLLVAHRWLFVAGAMALGIGVRWLALDWVWFVALGFCGVYRFTHFFPENLFALTAFGCGFFCASVEGDRLHTRVNLAAYDYLSGEVRSIQIKGPKALVIVDVTGGIDTSIKVFAERPLRGVTPGSRVVLEGPFKPLSGPSNPGGFDPKRAYGSLGTLWETRGAVQLVEPGRGLGARIFGFRSSSRHKLEGVDPAYGAGVLTGVLLGDRKAVPKTALTAFDSTGTAHLLAVSGLHIAVTAGMVFLSCLIMALALGWRYGHRLAAFAAIPPMIGYIILAQVPISAQRAGIMVGVTLLCVAFGRRQSALNSLGLASVVLMISHPSIIVTVGFQFSFGVVLILLVYGRRGQGPIDWLRTAILASLASMPVQAWHFGVIVPGAAVANLVITPIATTLVIPAGLIGFLWAPFTSLPLSWAAHLSEALVALNESVAELIGGFWVVGRWSTPLFVLPFLWPVLDRARSLAAVLALALVSWAIYLHPPEDTLDFVSVGQGDAIVLRSAGKTALVDAGPSPGAQKLLGYLRTEGIDFLDEVIVTHYHPDHFLGLETLLTQIPIKRLIHSGRGTESRAWLRVLKQAHGSGVTMEVAKTKDITLGRLNLRVFAPLASPWLSENDGSIAVRADGYGGSVLLTGDLEHIGELRLAAMNPGTVDVLKLGHHGSRTSTNKVLLESTSPRYAVASLGLDNRHGFPHSEVTDRLKRLEIPLYRTDEHGLVRVHLTRPIKVATPVRRHDDDLNGRASE